MQLTLLRETKCEEIEKVKLFISTERKTKMTSWWQRKRIWNLEKSVQNLVCVIQEPQFSCNKDTVVGNVTLYLKLFPSAGNYPQALQDFQECLSLQLNHLPPHSRLLAETHYHIATTLCYMDQYSQAIQHYNSSIEVIENRLGGSSLIFKKWLLHPLKVK